jgi:hypothetical protein
LLDNKTAINNYSEHTTNSLSSFKEREGKGEGEGYGLFFSPKYWPLTFSLSSCGRKEKVSTRYSFGAVHFMAGLMLQNRGYFACSRRKGLLPHRYWQLMPWHPPLSLVDDNEGFFFRHSIFFY